MIIILFVIILEELYTNGTMNQLQDLDISTKGHFKKQIFNPFDYQKALIDESNDPNIKTSLMIKLKLMVIF